MKMRLLDTHTLEIEEYIGNTIPPYAILSHTWGDDEVTFGEMLEGKDSIKEKAGYKKVQNFCQVAQRHELQFAWVDTCNIDKRSSAELSEAITSMYGYYCDADVCFIYLVDVPPLSDLEGSSQRQVEAFKQSRWFSRGWTLQELIAPKKRIFLTRDWKELVLDPAEHQFASLNHLICNITNISSDVLENHNSLPAICVAERMSWASYRQCTREEDAAYSLMGIFGVHFTVQYGEGLRNAFKRLQLEIIKTLADCSIFCWNGAASSQNSVHSGLLASSPVNFRNIPELGLWDDKIQIPFSMTNVGLHINVHILKYKLEGADPEDVLVSLDCDIKTSNGWGIVALRLKKIHGHKLYSVNGEKCYGYRRIVMQGIDAIPGNLITGISRQNIVVLEDEQYALQERAVAANALRGKEMQRGFKLCLPHFVD